MSNGITVEITKENTLAKAKAAIKAEITAKFIDFLNAEYGEGSAKMVRTGNTSKTNEVGVIVGTGIGEDGEENPICVTFNPTVKEFTNHKSEKKTYVPFDFAGAAALYDEYIETKAAKDAEAQALKEAKRKRDEAARAKAKEKMEAGE